MPYRANIFTNGGYYNIYNRGAGRNLIFFNPGNFEYCIRLVKHYYQKYGVAIIAYCLMPNHYHFLLRQETDLPVSKFISVLFNAYVQSLNRQQNPSGTLFEGRYRCVWIDREEYLLHLCRYIHLNPVKARITLCPEDWPYSNYLEWIEQREGDLIDISFIKGFFEKLDDYRQFIADYHNELITRGYIEKYIFD